MKFYKGSGNSAFITDMWIKIDPNGHASQVAISLYADVTPSLNA